MAIYWSNRKPGRDYRPRRAGADVAAVLVWLALGVALLLAVLP